MSMKNRPAVIQMGHSTDGIKKEVPERPVGQSGTSITKQYQDTPKTENSQGICIKCGKPVPWKGKLWVTCTNCGKMQIWEKNGKTTFDTWKENINGRTERNERQTAAGSR